MNDAGLVGSVKLRGDRPHARDQVVYRGWTEVAKSGVE